MPASDPVPVLRAALEQLQQELQQCRERIDRLEAQLRELLAPKESPPVLARATKAPATVNVCCPACFQPHRVPEPCLGETLQCQACRRFFQATNESIRTLLKRPPVPPEIPTVPCREAVCTYCYHPQMVPTADWGQTVQCPRCRHFYESGTLTVYDELGSVPRPSSVPLVEQEPSHLVGAHVCQHCRATLPLSADREHATKVCPHCRLQTSLYAILWHCPGCRKLLEAPTGDAGEPYRCKGCGRAGVVPQRVVWTAKTVRNGTAKRFYFPCPTCRRPLQSEWPNVGKTGVCPTCHILVSVPSYGTGSVQASTPDLSITELLQNALGRRCPVCGELILATAADCRDCGADLARG